MSLVSPLLPLWSVLRVLAETAIILVFLAMVATATAQVLARYVLGVPLRWSEELARYLFIWLSFLAAWLAWARREHLGIELLAGSLSARRAQALRILVELAVLMFAALSMYFGQRILAISAGQPSAVLRIPMAWIYAAFYVGMGLVVIETLAGWLERASGTRRP